MIYLKFVAKQNEKQNAQIKNRANKGGTILGQVWEMRKQMWKAEKKNMAIW